MRRPILGNGFPKLIPNSVGPTINPDLALQILDLRTASEDIQSRCFFVTLYGYFRTSVVASFIEVAQQDGNATPIEVASVSLAGSNSWPAPVPILTRFPVRGPQRLVVSNPDATAASLYVFGYVEVEEVDVPDPQGLRPLQIGKTPVKPYLGGAKVFDPGTYPLHQFAGGYIDEITLDITATEAGGEFGAGSCWLTLGSETLPLADPVFPLDGPRTKFNTLFPGIPMISSELLTITAGAGVGTQATVVGTFKRY